MIGIDTNILVRLLVRDDPAQTRQADEFLGRRCSHEHPGYVNRIVLCELAWTLDRTYGYGRKEIARALEGLLLTRQLVVEDKDQVVSALQVFRAENIGFSDALIAETNRAQGCEATATFDRKASRAPGFMSVS